ncbi:hypothetical protein HKD37_14G040296 [Glycine soja]
MYQSGPVGPSNFFLQKAVASGGSNLARLGELGGKLLPYFAINRGRSEEERVKSLDVTSLKELGRLMGPLQRQAFRKVYGKILDMTAVEVFTEAVVSLAQYYDQPLRCFTFGDFQMVPTIEEFEEILGCPLGGRKPYLFSGFLPSLSKIAAVVGDSAKELDRMKQTRNGVVGLPRKYLEGKARDMASQEKWGPFADILALLIFGVVLFPNMDGLVDLAVIDAFLGYHHSKESPVVAILADLFDTFDRRCEKNSARIVCCLPALCVWLISHLFQQDTRHPCPFQSYHSCAEKGRVDWDQHLVGIGGSAINWFPRWKEGKEGWMYPPLELIHKRCTLSCSHSTTQVDVPSTCTTKDVPSNVLRKSSQAVSPLKLCEWGNKRILREESKEFSDCVLLNSLTREKGDTKEFRRLVLCSFGKGRRETQKEFRRALGRRLQEDWAKDAREGHRVLMSLREYARSRHQRLFEENVEKTEKDAIYELLSERFGSCIYARGRVASSRSNNLLEESSRGPKWAWLLFAPPFLLSTPPAFFLQKNVYTDNHSGISARQRDSKVSMTDLVSAEDDVNLRVSTGLMTIICLCVPSDTTVSEWQKVCGMTIICLRMSSGPPPPDDKKVQNDHNLSLRAIGHDCVCGMTIICLRMSSGPPPLDDKRIFRKKIDLLQHQELAAQNRTRLYNHGGCTSSVPSPGLKSYFGKFDRCFTRPSTFLIQIYICLTFVFSSAFPNSFLRVTKSFQTLCFSMATSSKETAASGSSSVPSSPHQEQPELNIQPIQIIPGQASVPEKLVPRRPQGVKIAENPSPAMSPREVDTEMDKKIRSIVSSILKDASVPEADEDVPTSSNPNVSVADVKKDVPTSSAPNAEALPSPSEEGSTEEDDQAAEETPAPRAPEPAPGNLIDLEEVESDEEPIANRLAPGIAERLQSRKGKTPLKRSGRIKTMAHKKSTPITPATSRRSKVAIPSKKRKEISSSDSDEDVELDVSTSKKAKTSGKKVPGNVPDAPLDNISFHSIGNAERWKFVYQRRLALERELGRAALDCKEIMDLIKAAGLLKTVSKLGDCYEGLVREFIVNIPSDISNRKSNEYQKVFVRGKCVKFSPAVINKYLGRPTDGVIDIDVSEHQIAKEITAKRVQHWPKKGKLSAGKLSVKYAILHRIGAANWVPTNHTSTIATGLGKFLYAVGTKSKFNFGNYIFDQTVKHSESFAVKLPIAFPTVLCGIMLSQHPNMLNYTDSVMKRESPLSLHYKLFEGTHVPDIVSTSVSTSGKAAASGAVSKDALIAELKDTCKVVVATYPSAGGRRETRGMRVPRKEYARSRHQRLFEENVGKTGKDAIYELLSERFGSCIYARGSKIGEVVAAQLAQASRVASSRSNRLLEEYSGGPKWAWVLFAPPFLLSTPPSAQKNVYTDNHSGISAYHRARRLWMIQGCRMTKLGLCLSSGPPPLDDKWVRITVRMTKLGLCLSSGPPPLDDKRVRITVRMTKLGLCLSSGPPPLDDKRVRITVRMTKLGLCLSSGPPPLDDKRVRITVRMTKLGLCLSSGPPPLDDKRVRITVRYLRVSSGPPPLDDTRVQNDQTWSLLSPVESPTVATYPSAGGRRETRGMRVPRKEYARSRHQRLFEENVGKTGKDAIYELLSERFGSCIYARGSKIGEVVAAQLAQASSARPGEQGCFLQKQPPSGGIFRRAQVGLGAICTPIFTKYTPLCCFLVILFS